MTTSSQEPKANQISKVLAVAKSPSQPRKIMWSVRRGRRMSPRFSPESIWFTPRQISEQTRLSIEAVSSLLESDEHFVRAANIESEANEPVYAIKEDYQRKARALGRIASILVNKVVG